MYCVGRFRGDFNRSVSADPGRGHHFEDGHESRGNIRVRDLEMDWATNGCPQISSFRQVLTKCARIERAPARRGSVAHRVVAA